MAKQDYGSYHAEKGDIMANLQLATEDKGYKDTLWYIADFKFYTEPRWLGDSVGFSVNIHYSFYTLKEVFDRVKRANKGIEQMLVNPCNSEFDAETAIDVISCILSLEKQVPVPKEE